MGGGGAGVFVVGAVTRWHCGLPCLQNQETWGTRYIVANLVPNETGVGSGTGSVDHLIGAEIID